MITDLFFFYYFRQWFGFDPEGTVPLWQCCPAEKAVCATSFPWLLNYRVIRKNAVQVLIALSFGGDECGLLNPSLTASSFGFVGLVPLPHSPLVTHRVTSNIALCRTVAEAAQKIILTSQTISVR